MPANPELTPERIDELRRMTLQQRLLMAEQMYWDARRAKEFEVKQVHPEWSDQAVHAEVSRLFLIEAMKEG
jgi:hypothetical protein